MALAKAVAEALTIVVALITTGCSSFNREWKAAALHPTPTNTMTGRWEGIWRSEVNGHTDRLRCLITPGTNGTHAARFHAEYKRFFIRFKFGYTVPLLLKTNEGRFEFASEANLGWYAGGVYRYRGSVTPTNFFSTFDSKYDRGVFEMTRPAP